LKADLTDIYQQYPKTSDYIIATLPVLNTEDFLHRYKLNDRSLILNGLLSELGQDSWQAKLSGPLNLLFQHARELVMAGGDIVWEKYWRSLPCAVSQINPTLQTPSASSKCAAKKSGMNFGSAYGQEAESYNRMLESMNVTIDKCEVEAPMNHTIIAFNGYTFGPFKEKWLEEDFVALLEKHGSEASIKAVLEDAPSELHHIIVTSKPPDDDRETIDPEAITFSNSIESAIVVTISMNPVSDFAMQYVGFIHKLSQEKVRVNVILAPKDELVQALGFARYVGGGAVGNEST
jgi:hypothetical protein